VAPARILARPLHTKEFPTRPANTERYISSEEFVELLSY
jgi:hypothetical protein